jgi:CHAT domain-containing protein/tetratricopeptide (TPR) repeat protein
MTAQSQDLCPGPQILGAFIDGRLAGEELARVIEHLATCDDCLSVVEVVEVREPATPIPAPARLTPRRSWSFSRPLAIAASVAAIALLAAVALFLRGRGENDALRTLIAAAPTRYRTVEPRLSGFGWAELRRLRANEAIAPDPESLRFAGAAGEVLARGNADPRAAGVAELLLAQPEPAIERLREATSHDPRNAGAWNDLAAAQLASAAQFRRADELPDALAAVERALALDPRLAEARFNRALVLERMGLRAEAAEAWRAYLVVDSSSAWANEARQHLATLTGTARPFSPAELEDAARRGDGGAVEALVRAQTESVRRWTEAEILGRWGEEVLSKRPEAGTRLEEARLIGSVLLRVNGDALLFDAVAAIDRDPGALAAAHARYRRGRLRYRDHDLAGASSDLLDAAERFERAGSPMAGIARIYTASVLFDGNRIGDAAAAFEEVLRGTPARYASAIAETRHQLGRCALYEGRWSDAIGELSQAAEGFRRLGEPLSLALVESVLGDAFAGAGDRSRAWQHRIAAFDLLSRNAAGRRLLVALASATWSELRDAHLASAASLSMLEVGEANRTGTPLLVADAYKRRALLRGRAGDAASGMDDLREARAQLGRERASGLRTRVEAACLMVEGVLARPGDPDRSMDLLSRAIGFLHASGEQFDLAEAFLERARTQRSAGRFEAACDDFSTALRVVEQQRGKAGEQTVFDTVTPLFEEAVDFLIERGDAAEAFSYAERVHARVLLDARDAVPPSAASVMHAVPRGTVVVEYVLVPNGVIAFCLAPAEFHHVVIRASREVLPREIRRLREEIVQRAEPDAVHDASSRLYERLIAPLPGIAGARSIVVIADRELQAIPWGALWDRSRRQYLVERSDITIAPSAGLWLSARPRAGRGGERLLLVADDSRVDLNPLYRMQSEIDAVGSVYQDRLLLDKGVATPARFSAAANECDIIHFAGHARSGGGLDEAALLLAGELTVSDIRRLRLTRPRLAVLAGCSTISGDPASLEGMPSLARAFFGAGVPAVVGTLWPVDDAQAAILFSELHRRIRAGATTAAALREAQLSMIRRGGGSSHPVSWAGVELLGAAG